MYTTSLSTSTPSQDGNGRVGRLLLNYVLLKHGYPPVNILFEDRGRYYYCSQQYSSENKLEDTLEFLVEQYQKGGCEWVTTFCRRILWSPYYEPCSFS
ncbi:MAG: hypothetical protein R2741_03720 [Methanolobus sp.]